MEFLEIKESFLSLIPEKAMPLMQPIHFAMIDELVEHCLNGTSTINSRKPETIQEYQYMIMVGFIELVPTFDKLITGARNMYPNEEVDIIVNYRDQRFKMTARKAKEA